MTDGGFRPDDTFVSWPMHDTARLTEAFRGAVLQLFVRLELVDEDQATGMLTWLRRRALQLRFDHRPKCNARRGDGGWQLSDRSPLPALRC